MFTFSPGEEASVSFLHLGYLLKNIVYLIRGWLTNYRSTVKLKENQQVHFLVVLKFLVDTKK